MNITIFASIGSRNLGDELILKNEIALLKGEFPKDTSFRVASYDSNNPIFDIHNTSYFEYFPIGIKNPKNILRNIKNVFTNIQAILWSDIVVIGGGGIIYDSELQSVQNPLAQWKLRTKFIGLCKRKLYFYGVGIDIKKQEHLSDIKKIFSKAYKVTVRDEKSQSILKKVNIDAEIIDDPVMYDNANILKGEILGVYNSKEFLPTHIEDFDFSGKKVGLALRQGYIGNDLEEEKQIIEEVCRFIESQGGGILFLPHSFHKTDEVANDKIFLEQFLTRNREICVSEQEVYTVYTHKLIDIMISQRLHSIILSSIYGIPQITLSYSTKTDEIMKKLI